MINTKGEHMNKYLFLTVLIAIIASSTSTRAGLLGKRTFGINIGQVTPGDDDVKEFDDSILTYGANLRLPIDKHIDFIVNIGQAKISGNLPVYDPFYLRTYMVKVDGTSTSLGGGFTYQVRPSERVNPYVGLGLIWSKVKYESAGHSEDDDDAGVLVGGGIELNMNEQVSLDIGMTYQSEMFDEDDIIVGIGLNIWFTPEFRFTVAGEYGIDSENMGISGGIGIGF
jgi:hypothetical protein